MKNVTNRNCIFGVQLENALLRLQERNGFQKECKNECSEKATKKCRKP